MTPDKNIFNSNMQTPAHTFWKTTNWTIFCFQALILTIGLSRHIVFGKGLGDIFLWVLIVIAIIIHLTLTIVFKNKINVLRVLTIVFFIFTTYICLKSTIWRDIEYGWNGKIFYNSSF